jgi:hypothetical protein
MTWSRMKSLARALRFEKGRGKLLMTKEKRNGIVNIWEQGDQRRFFTQKGV